MSIFNEFDQVMVINARGSRWLFTDKCPIDGVWTVVCVAQNELIISRQESLLCIPVSGVRKIASYSVDALLAHIDKDLDYGHKSTNKSESSQISDGGKSGETSG